ncbi:MAG: gfo/Idh/MocA family oxidoreductase [Planctomycetota bacterium]|nr:MAG: gfo/Idh/MocA family oxidoreductase [Planctomycetota bacterium]
MNLTPEERAVGQANFNTVMGDMMLSRRDFVKSGALTALVAGGSLGAFYFGYESTLPRRVRVAVLGTGDEGNVLIGALNPEFHEVVAIADIRPYNVYRAFHGDHYSEAALAARPGLMAKYGWKTEDEARKHVKVYGDYRELLNSEKDLDGVIIGLPLHLHAPAAVMALQKGFHVITEKLMGHSVHECKEMARAAIQAKKHLAVGLQRHYNILYENAYNMILQGLLGDIHYIRGQWHRGNLPGRDSWKMPLPPGVKPDEDKDGNRLVKELDSWKKRLKEAEDRGDTKEVEKYRKLVAQKQAQIEDQVIAETVKELGYQDKTLEAPGHDPYFRPAIEELIRWRLWERTGGGLMAELGSHQLDAASIFVAAANGGEKKLPLNVVAAGNRPIFPLDREIEDHVYCIVEYPAPGYNPDHPVDKMKKIAFQYSSINGNGFGGYGEVIMGTSGTLIIEREKEAMLFAGSDTSAKVDVKKSDAGAALDTQASGPSQKKKEGLGAMVSASRGYKEELEHWAWCIVNNPDASDPEIHPRCYPPVALDDAVLALTTNMAAREGRRIEFKPEWFEIDSDETPEGVKPDLSRYSS